MSANAFHEKAGRSQELLFPLSPCFHPRRGAIGVARCTLGVLVSAGAAICLAPCDSALREWNLGPGVRRSHRNSALAFVFPLPGMIFILFCRFVLRGCRGCNSVPVVQRFVQGDFSVVYDFDGTTGSFPLGTLIQNTNGVLYGDTNLGGTVGNGVFYSLNVGLGPFVTFVSGSGKVGTTVEFLGQGFEGTTSASFNGTDASFTVKSNTYLTAIVPTGATTGSGTVATPSGTLNSNKKFVVMP